MNILRVFKGKPKSYLAIVITKQCHFIRTAVNTKQHKNLWSFHKGAATKTALKYMHNTFLVFAFNIFLSWRKIQTC